MRRLAEDAQNLHSQGKLWGGDQTARSQGKLRKGALRTPVPRGNEGEVLKHPQSHGQNWSSGGERPRQAAEENVKKKP